MSRPLADDEWFYIVDQEEGELLAAQIVEEVLQKVQQVLFQKHIASQIVPFSVNDLNDHIMEILEWNFTSRSTLQLNQNFWEPDDEPAMCPIDSWAKGALPVMKPVPVPIAVESTAEVVAEQAAEHQESKNTNRPTSEGSSHSKETVESHIPNQISTTDPSRPSTGTSTHHLPVKPKPPSSLKKTFVHGVPPEKIIAEENKKILAHMMAATEKDSKRLQFTHDHEGRLIPIRKIAPEKLFPKSVKAHVLPSIVKNTEKESEMDTAASNEERDARFILRAKQSVALRAAKSVNDGTTTEKLFYPEDESVKMPPLADIIRLAPGVTIKENTPIKVAQPNKVELTPIRRESISAPAAAVHTSQDYDPSWALEQIMSKAKPRLKPLTGERIMTKTTVEENEPTE